MTSPHPLPTIEVPGKRSHKRAPNRVPLAASSPGDIACGPMPAPRPVLAAPRAGYSASLRAVASDYNPKKYDRYL